MLCICYILHVCVASAVKLTVIIIFLSLRTFMKYINTHNNRAQSYTSFVQLIMKVDNLPPNLPTR